MAPHILQVAYYPTLRDIRARMLRAAGYQVTSVSGNQEAKVLDNATLATVNRCSGVFIRAFCSRGNGPLVEGAPAQHSRGRTSIGGLGEISAGGRGYSGCGSSSIDDNNRQYA
jgi:hypothetical protein